MRDFDAHSWVEVYFNGIGWVAFDPTPAVAPPKSQASGLGLLRFLPVTAGGKPLPRRGAAATSTTAKGGEQAAATGSSAAIPLWVAPIALALALIAGAIAVATRAIRYRSLSPAAAAEARLRELEAALPRLRSWTVGGTTLLALEHRLGQRRWTRRPPATRRSFGLPATRRGTRGSRPRQSAAPCAASSPPASACAPGCGDCWQSRPAAPRRCSEAGSLGEPAPVQGRRQGESA